MKITPTTDNTIESLPLFKHYPNRPGYKREGTSKLAADEIAREASELQSRCLEVIKLRPSTSDEVASALNRSVLAIRPRVSELLRKGLITETTERRINSSGKMAAVWKAL